MKRLSINAYLAQLPQPQISFSVCQKQPATLDDAVSATLEMESYLPLQSPPAVNSTLPAPEEPTISVDAVDKVTHLTRLVAKQVERLQQNDDEQSHARGYERRRGPPTGPRRRFLGQCWNCQQTGHRSRDCLQPRRQQNQQQEN